MKLTDNPQFSLRYVDKIFWFLFGLLIVAAFLALFSASSTLVYKAGSIGPVARQMMFIFGGVLVAWCVQFMPTWMVRLCGYLLLGVSVLCLYVMLVPGNPFVVSINGAGRWFRLGITFQPSEFAKVGLMIVVADQLARMKDEKTESRKYFLRTLTIAGITIFPIMLGNLSTAILMALIVGILWFLARIDWRYIISTILIAMALLVGGYFIVEYAFIRPGKEVNGLFGRAATWVSRVDNMLEEKQEQANGSSVTLDDDNYQRNLAKVAVARGGASPFGVLPGNSKERDYLPLAYADYIFAIIVEETGVVGAVALIFLYLAILFRACWTSSRYADHTAMLMVMGLAFMLTCQAFISMAVAVGLGPVTGQPLPMITMGGSSSLATALYFGVMMAVSREQNMLQGQQDDIRRESEQDIPEIVDL